MKKSLIALALAGTLLLTGCSDGLLSSPTTNDLKAPDAYYEIDTWGANSEVYEFTPTTAPEKTCVLFLTDSVDAATMQCFDKQ
jgi:hypothetical protein